MDRLACLYHGGRTSLYGVLHNSFPSRVRSQSAQLMPEGESCSRVLRHRALARRGVSLLLLLMWLHSGPRFCAAGSLCLLLSPHVIFRSDEPMTCASLCLSVKSIHQISIGRQHLSIGRRQICLSCIILHRDRAPRSPMLGITTRRGKNANAVGALV